MSKRVQVHLGYRLSLQFPRKNQKWPLIFPSPACCDNVQDWNQKNGDYTCNRSFFRWKHAHQKSRWTIIDTDDNITVSGWAKMAKKVRMDDKLILGIIKLNLQASSLAALEIVLEDIVLKVTSMRESLSQRPKPAGVIYFFKTPRISSGIWLENSVHNFIYQFSNCLICHHNFPFSDSFMWHKCWL